MFRSKRLPHSLHFWFPMHWPELINRLRKCVLRYSFLPPLPSRNSLFSSFRRVSSHSHLPQKKASFLLLDSPEKYDERQFRQNNANFSNLIPNKDALHFTILSYEISSSSVFEHLGESHSKSTSFFLEISGDISKVHIITISSIKVYLLFCPKIN